MSLNLYVQNYSEPDKEIIMDSELYFVKSEITDCDKVRHIIEYIEHGKYLDNKRFLDRFGTAVYLDDLSTGSKVALNVLLQQDKVFSAVEAGYNALSCILHNSVGNVWLPRLPYIKNLDLDYDMDCDIYFCNKHFTKFSEIIDTEFIL